MQIREYREDLTEFVESSQSKIVNVSIRSIGFLGSSRSFAQGELLDGFIDAFRHIMENHREFSIVCSVVRGGYHCPFCDFKDTPLLRDELLSEALLRMPIGSLIWIPCQTGLVYATHSLCYHYSSEHGYSPPLEFQQAVIFFSENHDRFKWNANEFYEAAVGITGGRIGVEFS
ncbi:MAG: hypothetical protein KDB07_11685 [Planctomycetes bacterium]|nr:hypothetical protein [Planctomycetota bacterium]